jgi:hypothetical protein
MAGQKQKPQIYKGEYMRAAIGEAAGKIWKTLKTKEEISISQLPKILGEKTLIIHQALGWLAREDKIVYRTKGNKILVSLTESERNI